MRADIYSELSDKQLKRKISDASRKRAAYTNVMRYAEKELERRWIARSPIQVGDIVIHRNGKQYKVTTIDPRDETRFWYSGVTQLKNGQWGKLAHDLYDFVKLVSKAKVEE